MAPTATKNLRYFFSALPSFQNHLLGEASNNTAVYEFANLVFSSSWKICSFERFNLISTSFKASKSLLIWSSKKIHFFLFSLNPSQIPSPKRKPLSKTETFALSLFSNLPEILILIFKFLLSSIELCVIDMIKSQLKN